MRVDVGAVDDFLDGSATVVVAGRREIGVVRWHGRFYALRNVCPHESGPLCRGQLLSLIRPGSEVGDLDVDPTIPVMACPWHGWEFDVRTGRTLWSDARMRVRTYAVSVCDDRVILELPGS